MYSQRVAQYVQPTWNSLNVPFCELKMATQVQENDCTNHEKNKIEVSFPEQHHPTTEFPQLAVIF